MPLHARQAGSWEEIGRAHVLVAGTWEPVKVYVRVAGTWEPVVGIVNITDATYYDSGIGSAEANVTFKSDGTVVATDDSGTSQRNASTDWIIPNALAGADFEIMVSATGDALDVDSDDEDTWLTLDVDREWGQSVGSGGRLESTALSVQIRHVPTQIVLDTGTITLTADTT